MINYIVYIVIIIILILVSVLAIKAINRGIKAKQKLNKDYYNEKFENKKKNRKN
tara:strand:+ start:863 stop:1024 length:162 start_codon:yes stop_codon:yes gene_type:complete